MRGLLLFIAIMALVVFFMPVILGFLLFLTLLVLVFMLLARFGLLPGSVYRSYRRRTTTENPGEAYRGTVDAEKPGPRRNEQDESAGWYQDVQEGEIITLPETALTKIEDENEKRS